MIARCQYAVGLIAQGLLALWRERIYVNAIGRGWRIRHPRPAVAERESGEPLLAIHSSLVRRRKPSGKLLRAAQGSRFRLIAAQHQLVLYGRGASTTTPP